MITALVREILQIQQLKLKSREVKGKEEGRKHRHKEEKILKRERMNNKEFR